MRYLITLIVFGFLTVSHATETDEQKRKTVKEQFTFVFMTDIHLTHERNATLGFMQAIDSVNKIAPDFVITGGDLIMDALAQSYSRSDSAYQLYNKIVKKFEMPVYNTMGNHELFGVYEESGVDTLHSEYGKKMYENRIGKPYYSFDYGNWHFVVLDGTGTNANRRYYGYVDSLQLQWLEKDLEKTGNRPIAVSIHIPLLSVASQIIEGATEPMSERAIVNNANQVREILEKYNTRLVLQGHLHFLEDINYNGIRYITGGAVSSKWWTGTRHGLEEGFLKIDVDGEDFSWEYIDYGWEAE